MVSLIEYILVARQRFLQNVDKVLKISGDWNVVRAARVWLAVPLGEC